MYGGGSVVRTGTLARVKESLVKAGVEFVELSGVRPNPEVASVREGIAVAQENDVDLVLPCWRRQHDRLREGYCVRRVP